MLGRKNCGVVSSEHLIGFHAGQARRFAIEKQIAPRQVFGKDRIFGAVGNGVEQTQGLEALRLGGTGLVSGLGEPLGESADQQVEQDGSYRDKAQAFEGIGGG